MAESNLYSDKPISNVIIDSVLSYKYNINRNVPIALSRILRDPNTEWEFAGFDNLSCEYWIKNKASGDMVTYNYKSNEVLYASSDSKVHKYYSPKQRKWIDYTPEEGKHYNPKKDKFGYYNPITGEWVDEKGTSVRGSNSDAIDYTVKYDKDKNVFKYNNKEASAIYLVEKGVWGIFDKNTKRLAYFDVKTGKELVLDKKSKRLIPKELVLKIAEEKKRRIEESKREKDREIDKILYEVRERNNKKDQKPEEKKEESPFDNISLKNLIEWLKRKARSIAGFFGIKTKADRNKVVYRSRNIYRSPETIAKIEEKENKKRELKLSLKKKLKYFDDKRHIGAAALTGIAALGVLLAVEKGPDKTKVTPRNNSSFSTSINLLDINKPFLNQNNNTEKENTTKIDTTEPEKDDGIIRFASQEEPIVGYYVPKGTVYTENSAGEGKKGTLKSDTLVEVYNRAIIETQQDGSVKTILTSKGKTWEEYAQSTGMSLDEINEMLNRDNTQEVLAIQIAGTEKDIKNVKGWVKAQDEKGLTQRELDERQLDNDNVR